MEDDGLLSSVTSDPYLTIWEPTASQKAIVEDALQASRFVCRNTSGPAAHDAAEIARAVCIILGAGLQDAFRDIDAVDDLAADLVLIAFRDAVTHMGDVARYEPDLGFHDDRMLKRGIPQFVWASDIVWH